MRRLHPSEVETWIFDLDNTLYPVSNDLFGQIMTRMNAFIAELLGLDEARAQALRKQYFREHGTSLRGLMAVHGIDPQGFLDYVHDIDLTALAPALELDAALDALPGRKFVHTNASARHAERILERLGLARHFEGVFDIADAGFLPKPDPAGYALLTERFGVRPERAAMIEDMARNLKPAAELGMLTVWIRTPNDWAVEGSIEDWVHHHADDLALWLAGCRAPAG